MKVVIPPARFGSRGDEAAIRGILFLTGPSKITYHEKMLFDWRQLDLPLTDFELPYPTEVICFGADVFDGSYGPRINQVMLKWADLAVTSNNKATVCGFSFRKDITKEIITRINYSSDKIRFVCRDTLSKNRFEELTNKTCTFAPDPAFLLPEEKLPENIESWLTERKEYDIIGININQYLTTISKTNYYQLKEVFNTKDYFVLISHDSRPSVSDVIPLSNLYDSLPSEIRKRCLLLLNSSAGEIKSVCKHLRYVLTGRLHLGIVAASVGIPSSMIKYNDKVEGVAQMLCLDDCLTDSNYSNVREVSEKLKYKKTQLLERIPEILELAKGNYV